MKIVAIIDMSAGNESVGEMWQETQIFDSSDSLDDVLAWASPKVHREAEEIAKYGLPKRLTITVPAETL